MRTITRTFTTGALLLGVLGASAAHGQVTLTGSWAGKAVCSGARDGALVRSTYPATLQISQGVDAIKALIAVRPSPGTSLISGPQCGNLADPAPGKALVAFGSNLAPQAAIATEVFTKVSAFPENRRGESGQMRGTGTIAIQGGTVLSCRYTLKRTSQVDPVLPGVRCDR